MRYFFLYPVEIFSRISFLFESRENFWGTSDSFGSNCGFDGPYSLGLVKGLIDRDLSFLSFVLFKEWQIVNVDDDFNNFL